MDHYAVIGRPVHHSWSPFLFSLFASQTEQSLQYKAQEVEPNDLQQALMHFKHNGGLGVNVTLPLKTLAFSCVDALSKRAQQAKVINLISFCANGQLHGDNVDGLGLVRDITINNRYSLTNKRILIIGAGGAARGVLPAILNEYPSSVILVNRTASKATSLAKEYQIDAATWATLKGKRFDLVINSTSASLTYTALPLPHGILHSHSYCYDMVYSRTITPFLQWAKNNHAALCCDGRGMLIEQAAETFYVWRNKRIDTTLAHMLLNRYLQEDHHATATKLPHLIHN
jgi:shikimate dehydrogenase